MKDKYEGCYIDGYKDHYAVFADNGEKLAEYDTHKEAKEDIAEWEAEVKNESYIPADTLATGYRFTIHETELLENAIKKHVEQKVDQGVNAMFDTDSKEFKKVGNELYDKSQWWDDMKLTMRIKKTPFPRKNGYTNGDFRPNQKWLMGAIECCKSARDCDYLLKDAYLSVAHDKKLIQNLKSVRDGNPNKYVNVKVVQKWLDNGVTPEKVEKHIEWFKANYIKGLQAKKKEFNKAQNETATEDPMNEGAVGIGSIVFCSIFLGAAIIGKAKTALDKHKKKSELKTGKNAYKLPYDKFNQIYRSMTNLIKDIKRLQKESKYYNLIYNYNEIREDVSNNKSGVNISEVYKKGSPIQLYGMVEYYSAESIERYKNLLASMPDPKKNWYDSENEDYIQDIEQKVYDEFDKHLDILGFSEDKSESYKLKSSKYPGIYIHMTINGDGAYFTIYPDYPKNVFILGDESENDLNSKSKKKLNEDHSEISNDPEMEELMALTGVTAADLDDLDNDNDLDLDDDDPIDSNTLREIDEAMDESTEARNKLNEIRKSEDVKNIKLLIKDGNKLTKTDLDLAAEKYEEAKNLLIELRKEINTIPDDDTVSGIVYMLLNLLKQTFTEPITIFFGLYRIPTRIHKMSKYEALIMYDKLVSKLDYGINKLKLAKKKNNKIANESFLGIKSKKEKNAKELTKAEFDKLINDMVSINDAIISKLKTSKWWKSIFEPCYNSRYYKTPNIHEEATNYKREFSTGKCVAPSFSSKFTNINSSDPEIYVNLDDPENIDLSNHDSVLDNGYRESKKLIEEAIKKLGFNNGKSDKYPDIKVSISQGAYISFDIAPTYTGNYKLKDAKKSQNESTETNLDILLSESAEFLFDE